MQTHFQDFGLVPAALSCKYAALDILYPCIQVYLPGLQLLRQRHLVFDGVKKLLS